MFRFDTDDCGLSDRAFKADKCVHRIDADFFNIIAALHNKKRRQSCAAYRHQPLGNHHF